MLRCQAPGPRRPSRLTTGSAPRTWREGGGGKRNRGMVDSRSRIAIARVLALSLDQPRTRSLIAAVAAVGLEVGLHVPVGDWPEGQPIAATAGGVAVAVVAAAFGGVPAGLIAAAAGWTLNVFFVADELLDAL